MQVDAVDAVDAIGAVCWQEGSDLIKPCRTALQSVWRDSGGCESGRVALCPAAVPSCC